MHWPCAAAIQLFVLLFKLTNGCMSTANPDPDPTTVASASTVASTTEMSTEATVACTCTQPANTAAPTCGAASALPAPTITTSTADPCTVSWSGCMNYRYIINGMCVLEPIFADETDVQGGYTCNNGFPTDSATGKVYEAIDCF